MRGIILSTIGPGEIALYSEERFQGRFPLKPGIMDLEDFQDLLDTKAETLIDISRAENRDMMLMLQFDPYEENTQCAISRLRNVCEYLM